MQTESHKKHLASRISHSDCCECRADTERRFVDRAVWKYDHVSEYLAYIRPRLDALHTGKYAGDSDAIIWLRKFVKALHTRISLKVQGPCGRKHSHGYLERLRMTQFPGNRADSGYLRQFASRGASCLDY